MKDIIARERAARTERPAAFPKSRSSVRRDGCYYVYIEYMLPATPEANYIFRLNQYGAIVDVQRGNEPDGGPNCPDKTLTEGDLAEIVRRERAARKDLPPPLPAFKATVSRLHCLYLYYEEAVPGAKGNYNVFTIDPFGGLMEASFPHPY